jgi:hypothetical protein
MKSMKTVAMTALLAGCAAMVGSTAFAADSAADMKAKCEKDAKDKGLTGDALKAALKKCAEPVKK